MAMNDYQFGKQRLMALSIPQSRQAIPNIDEITQLKAKYDAKKLASAIDMENRVRQSEFQNQMAERAYNAEKQQYPWAVATTLGGIGMAGLGALKAQRNEEKLSEHDAEAGRQIEYAVGLMHKYPEEFKTMMLDYLNRTQAEIDTPLSEYQQPGTIPGLRVPKYSGGGGYTPIKSVITPRLERSVISPHYGMEEQY